VRSARELLQQCGFTNARLASPEGDASAAADAATEAIPQIREVVEIALEGSNLRRLLRQRSARSLPFHWHVLQFGLTPSRWRLANPGSPNQLPIILGAAGTGSHPAQS